MEEKVNKLTCKKLPDFKEMFDIYYKSYFKSYGISRLFKIQQNQKTQMFELFADGKALGQWKTFDEAVEFANKFNQDDYSDLCAKIIKWEAE